MKVTSARTAGSGYPAALLALAIGVAGPCVAQSDVPPTDSHQPLSEVVEAIEIGAVRARTGALLLSGQAGGTVDGALIWSLTDRDENGKVEVPFVVEVDGGMLLAGRGGRRIAIGVFASLCMLRKRSAGRFMHRRPNTTPIVVGYTLQSTSIIDSA